MTDFIPDRKIYSVAELNRAVRTLLESHLSLIWLQGEVSNLARPASGHLYFSIKDATAQIRCALFRNRSRWLDVDLSNGQQVLIRGRISLYEPRGDYQLIAEHVEDAGTGALRQAFEALKQKLANEGLFAEQRKRSLPTLPRRIGVVTSPSGAAIRDVLSVIQRRFAGLPVLIYPTAVQGEQAATQISRALALAAQRRECDVLLLVRGGGSLEDLWAFNEEPVARAIAACAIPIVSGVGHETDVTIADFSADVRAPTPSAAAELVCPDRESWVRSFKQLQQQIERALRRHLMTHRQTLDGLTQRLARLHPGRRLQEADLQLKQQQQRLVRAMRQSLSTAHHALREQLLQLKTQHPGPLIRQSRLRQQLLVQRLWQTWQQVLERRQQQLANLSRALHGVSPLQTLARGYAIVREVDQDGGQGTIIRDSKQVDVGATVQAQLKHGRLSCKVIAKFE